MLSAIKIKQKHKDKTKHRKHIIKLHTQQQDELLRAACWVSGESPVSRAV